MADEFETIDEEKVSDEMPPLVQPRSLGGRPPGRQNLRSKEAAKRLKELGFDPMEELIKTHDEAYVQLHKERNKAKPSAMLMAALYGVLQKTEEALMRYGYSRTPEQVDVNHKIQPKPMQVVLTGAPAALPAQSTETMTVIDNPDLVRLSVEQDQDYE